MNRHIAGEVDWSRFTRLGVLGLDEIALTKGHQDFVTIVTCRLESVSSCQWRARNPMSQIRPPSKARPQSTNPTPAI